MITLQPIGYVRGGRSDPDDDNWSKVRATVELDAAQFEPSAFIGIQSFSHAEIVFMFDRVNHDEITFDARHPRGRKDWPKVGIFAQRGKNRPNRLGVSICRIVSLDGLRLEVEGLDAIDGTPVLDVKPVMSGFLPRETVHEPEWAAAIMANYWIK